MGRIRTSSNCPFARCGLEIWLLRDQSVLARGLGEYGLLSAGSFEMVLKRGVGKKTGSYWVSFRLGLGSNFLMNSSWCRSNRDSTSGVEFVGCVSFFSK